MTKFLTLTFNRQNFTEALYFAFCIFLIILVSACGEGYYSSSETGSIAFIVKFKGISYEGSELHAMALDCDAAGVETVVAEIYDEASLYLTSGGPWLCSAHAGTIGDVPAGTNRTIVVIGKDINGNVLYRGEKSGVTVTAGQTTNAGTIEVEPFSSPFDPPTLISPTDGETVTSGSYSFEWESVTGASEYQIQVSTDSNFTSTVIEEALFTTSYAPTTALSANTYYWRVRAEDSSGNQSAWSAVWSFTVSAEPGTAPIAPTSVTAIAGNEKVNISWDAVAGATSYTIYWANSFSDVSTTNYEGKIEYITETTYTHADLDNGCTYYYVVTALNDYGESDESEEVSATPAAILISAFDIDDEGWTAEGASITHEMSGGNPGGFLSIEDTGDDTFIILSPAKFHGNLLSFDGGILSYDVMAIDPTEFDSIGSGFGRIQLIGGGTNATFDYAPYPGPPSESWTTYYAPLTAEAWNTTQENWELVLSDVTYISIILEPVNWCTVGFDNFLIQPFP